MTPKEAREKLLANGFFSLWLGRSIVGGSHYKPGNPGVFEGLRFAITLVEAGNHRVDLTDFDGQTREVEPGPTLRSLAGGDTRDLEWAVNAVLEALWAYLDRNKGASPPVPMDLVLQAAREAPDAKTEVELLTRLVYMSHERETELRAALDKVGHRVLETKDELPEHLIATALPSNREANPQWAPPVVVSETKAVGAPSKNLVSYRQLGEGLTYPGLPERSERAVHWFPLEARDTWPTVLHRISPFGDLATPREMTPVLFMSALRQVLEKAPGWLEVLVFGCDPVEGKLTACFVGSKSDPPRSKLPDWLLELARPHERNRWTDPLIIPRPV